MRNKKWPICHHLCTLNSIQNWSEKKSFRNKKYQIHLKKKEFSLFFFCCCCWIWVVWIQNLEFSVFLYSQVRILKNSKRIDKNPAYVRWCVCVCVWVIVFVTHRDKNGNESLSFSNRKKNSFRKVSEWNEDFYIKNKKKKKKKKCHLKFNKMGKQRRRKFTTLNHHYYWEKVLRSTFPMAKYIVWEQMSKAGKKKRNTEIQMWIYTRWEKFFFWK